MPSIILASGSPRRRQLLRSMGWAPGWGPLPRSVARGVEHCNGKLFRIVPSQIHERGLHGEIPRAFALRMSLEKARNVAEGMRKRCWVIGADTIVTIDGRILGKPGSRKEARSMLARLQGRTHRVITGLTLLAWPGRVAAKGGWVRQTWVQTRVTMKRMSDDEIERYIATGEPFDKAGAYAIQGNGGYLVKKIQGSYTNVVGLPLCEMYELMEKACG